MPYFSVFAKARDPNVSSAQELHPEALSSSASANSLHPSRPASMSPSWRTKRWLHGEASSIRRHGSAGENVSPRKITENRIKKSKRKSFWDISIVNNLFAQWNVKQIDQGLDGDTLIKEELTQGALQDNDNTLINDEMDKQIDFRDSILKYNDPRIKDWSHDEVWVFNKLSKRGFEPLLSDEWKWDFPSFPDPLFSRDKKLVFINNLATTITDGKSLSPHPTMSTGQEIMLSKSNTSHQRAECSSSSRPSLSRCPPSQAPARATTQKRYRKVHEMVSA